MDIRVFLFGLVQKDGLSRTNMRSAAKAWSPVIKAGSHGADRARPLPAASSGMKSSKSSTSLAFESRLSKVQTEAPAWRRAAGRPPGGGGWAGGLKREVSETRGLSRPERRL